MVRVDSPGWVYVFTDFFFFGGGIGGEGGRGGSKLTGRLGVLPSWSSHGLSGCLQDTGDGSFLGSS